MMLKPYSIRGSRRIIFCDRDKPVRDVYPPVYPRRHDSLCYQAVYCDWRKNGAYYLSAGPAYEIDGSFGSYEVSWLDVLVMIGLSKSKVENMYAKSDTWWTDKISSGEIHTC